MERLPKATPLMPRLRGKLSLHWNTTSPHRQWTEMQTATDTSGVGASYSLGKSDGICGMAWVSFPWNQCVRQLRSKKYAGEELVLAFHLDNQVDGTLIVGGITGAHYRGGEHQLLAC